MNHSHVPTVSRALIAGCGYVGRRVADVWRQRELQTFAITRDPIRAEQLAAEGIEPLIIDLGSPLNWPSLPDADVVLWSVGFDRRPGANREAVWINGLRTLLDRLPVRAVRRQIVYTSSSGVYGDCQGEIVDEQSNTIPDSEGGKACLMAEQLLVDHAEKSGDRVSILRLAGIYGPNRLLRRVSELHNQVPINSPPDEWLNLIHVDDAVRAIDCIVTRQDVPETRLLNVVSRNSVTRRTYYTTLAELVGAPQPVFDTSGRSVPSSTSTAERIPRRGGNRRVISGVRDSLPLHFQFDDLATGLAHAIAESGTD